MNLIVSIPVSLIAFFVLMLVTSNLTGMLVRGFFVQDTDFLDFVKKGRARPYAKEGVSTGGRADKNITIVFSVIMVLFLYLLYHFLNIWAVAAALMLIFSRIPDLLWEIKTGKKVTTTERPRGRIYLVTDITMWLALLILWWSLYNL